MALNKFTWKLFLVMRNILQYGNYEFILKTFTNNGFKVVK